MRSGVGAGWGYRDMVGRGGVGARRVGAEWGGGGVGGDREQVGEGAGGAKRGTCGVGWGRGGGIGKR